MSYVGRIDVEKQEISACQVSIIDISTGGGGGGGYINYDRITVFHIVQESYGKIIVNPPLIAIVMKPKGFVSEICA